VPALLSLGCCVAVAVALESGSERLLWLKASPSRLATGPMAKHVHRQVHDRRRYSRRINQ
jgi:hypothetical protein